eukprot:g4035.t1
MIGVEHRRVLLFLIGKHYGDLAQEICGLLVQNGPQTFKELHKHVANLKNETDGATHLPLELRPGLLSTKMLDEMCPDMSEEHDQQIPRPGGLVASTMVAVKEEEGETKIPAKNSFDTTGQALPPPTAGPSTLTFHETLGILLQTGLLNQIDRLLKPRQCNTIPSERFAKFRAEVRQMTPTNCGYHQQGSRLGFQKVPMYEFNFDVAKVLPYFPVILNTLRRERRWESRMQEQIAYRLVENILMRGYCTEKHAIEATFTDIILDFKGLDVDLRYGYDMIMDEMITVNRILQRQGYVKVTIETNPFVIQKKKTTVNSVINSSPPVNSVISSSHSQIVGEHEQHRLLTIDLNQLIDLQLKSQILNFVCRLVVSQQHQIPSEFPRQKHEPLEITRQQQQAHSSSIGSANNSQSTMNRRKQRRRKGSQQPGVLSPRSSTSTTSNDRKAPNNPLLQVKENPCRLTIDYRLEDPRHWPLPFLIFERLCGLNYVSQRMLKGDRRNSLTRGYRLDQLVSKVNHCLPYRMKSNEKAIERTIALMEDHFGSPLILTQGDDITTPKKYLPSLTSILEVLRTQTIKDYVHQKFGIEARRVFSCVEAQHLRDKEVGTRCMLDIKEARKYLYLLQNDGLIKLAELSKNTFSGPTPNDLFFWKVVSPREKLYETLSARLSKEIMYGYLTKAKLKRTMPDGSKRDHLLRIVDQGINDAQEKLLLFHE